MLPISDHHDENPATLGPIHAFLRGDGCDGRGRLLVDVLAFDDARIAAGSRA